MGPEGKAERFLEAAGCGLFQVILYLFAIFIPKTGVAYSILFMSFGNYNPGWRCLDNVTSHTPNNSTILESTTIDSTTSLDYTQGSCDVYSECNKVEFNPDTSTVVTEWGLLCDNAWMSSLTISIQMLGMLMGSFVGGQLSDLLGRRIILYVTSAFVATCHLISSFSMSLSMFIIFRFLIGGCASCILVINFSYTSEYMPKNWRATIVSFPVWYVGGTFQSLIAMGSKNWRTVELVGGGIYLLHFLTVLWVPESLRWLEVKRKTNELVKVAKKIAKYNKIVLPPMEELNLNPEGDCGDNKHDKKYTMLDLLRPGYKFITLCVAFLDFIFSIVYYSLTFGIKSLYGNFYINLILFNIISIPFLLCGMLALRYLKRKTMALLFLSITIVCSFSATACLLSKSDDAKAIGTTIFLSVAKCTVDAAWLCIFARVGEMYPTVIRSTAIGFASLTARVGGMIAPFLIPNDKGSMYIFILISAGILVICSIVSHKLPETKNKPLKETFDTHEKKTHKDNATAKEQEI